MARRQNQKRQVQRQAAAAAWGELNEKTQVRTGLLIAAFFLDEIGSHELADCLLLAKFETCREVAAGVGAVSLRDGLTHVWDALAAAGAMDMEKATWLYETDGELIWEPPPNSLIRNTTP